MKIMKLWIFGKARQSMTVYIFIGILSLSVLLVAIYFRQGTAFLILSQ
jgi:hypothetical protein